MFAFSLAQRRASEHDPRVLAVGLRPGDMQLVFPKRDYRPAGITFGVAQLLDRAPSVAVGCEGAQVYLRLVVAIEVVPRQVNRIIVADDQIIVENLRRVVGMHQLTRREALAVIFRHAVVNAGLLFRSAEGEPSDVKLAARVTSEAGP
jgi:hypothetical protein